MTLLRRTEVLESACLLPVRWILLAHTSVLGWFVATESVVGLKRDDSVDNVVVTNASCESRKPPSICDALSSVWRLVSSWCRQAD